eukprot:sb/3461328/
MVTPHSPPSVKAHEFWDEEREWAGCGDCELDGLPYTKEWYNHRFSRPIPNDENITPRTAKPVTPGDHDSRDKFIREREESESEGEGMRKKSPLRDTIGRIKEHVRSIKKNKLYPNAGPLQANGGEIPGGISDLSQLRKDWQPPGRDTVPDIEFEKAKAMFGRYRNPLSGTSASGTGNEIYPEFVPESEPAPAAAQQQPQMQKQYDPYGMPQGAPGMPGAGPGMSGAGPHQGQMYHMYPGMMYPGAMMYPPGNRYPPFFPYPGMAGAPPFGGYNMPQPAPQQPAPAAPVVPEVAQTGCPVTRGEPGGCGSNPSDPLPTMVSAPSSTHGKTRPAPPPPLSVNDADRPSRNPDIRSSVTMETDRTPQPALDQHHEQVSLYPSLLGNEDDNLRRSYKRSSMRHGGGSLRQRNSTLNRSVRFAVNRLPESETAIKKGDNINTILKDADNPHSIVIPKDGDPETVSMFKENLGVQDIPILKKGDHISALADPGFGVIQRGEKVSDAIKRAESPAAERIEDVRYPNLRRMSEAIHPTGDESNYYPNLHEVPPAPPKVQEFEDTDDEIEHYTRQLTRDILGKSGGSISKPTVTDLKRALAKEIEEAIRDKKLLKGDLRKAGPKLKRSMSEKKKGCKPSFGFDEGAHSDNDWWSNNGKSRRRVIPAQHETTTSSSSDSSSSSSSDSTSSSSSSSSESSEGESSVNEEYILSKVKEYLAKRNQKKKAPVRKPAATGSSSDSSDTSEEDGEEEQSSFGRRTSRGSLFASDRSNASKSSGGLASSIARQLRNGSTKFKRSIAESLMTKQPEIPDLRRKIEHRDHSLWDHVGSKERLDDSWKDHFDPAYKIKREMERVSQADETLADGYHGNSHGDDKSETGSVAEFQGEMEFMKQHLSKEDLMDSDELEEEERAQESHKKKGGFFTRMLKKRPKYSFPNFARRQLNHHGDEGFAEGDKFDATRVAYISSGEDGSRKSSRRGSTNSVLLDKISLLEKLDRLDPDQKLVKKSRSLTDIAELNRQLEKLNDLTRTNSLDYDLSKKPGQTATGYLNGHAALKGALRNSKSKLSRSLSRSLKSLRSSGRSSGYSSKSDKRVCVGDGEGEVCVDVSGGGFGQDMERLSMAEMLDKYNPEYVKKSLENLGA